MSAPTPGAHGRSAKGRARKKADAVEFYQPQSYQADDTPAYLMRRIIASLGNEVGRELQPLGLTSGQWVPLRKLHMGEASTPAELARSCLLDAGAMTRTLDRLEAKGLIRRVRSAADRRVVQLELTAEGDQAAQHIPAAVCKVLNQHLRGFNESELAQLQSLLHRILDNALALQAERESHAPDA